MAGEIVPAGHIRRHPLPAGGELSMRAWGLPKAVALLLVIMPVAAEARTLLAQRDRLFHHLAGPAQSFEDERDDDSSDDRRMEWTRGVPAGVNDCLRPRRDPDRLAAACRR